MEVFLKGPAIPDAYLLPPTILQAASGIWIVRDGQLQSFQPEAYGWIPNGWVVKAFDAGEGVVVGPLPGACPGLEVSPQAVQADR